MTTKAAIIVQISFPLSSWHWFHCCGKISISKMLSNSFPILSRTRIVYSPLPRVNSTSKSLYRSVSFSRIVHSHQPSSAVPLSGISFRNRWPLPPQQVSCGAQDLPSGEDDPRAVEAVLKLYTAMKNKNFEELSDIIGEECLCSCNFISSFQPFRGKEKVLEFFSSLIKNLGNNIEFVVQQPTFLDGMAVGVSWKLEWKNTRVPLGKGFSFYMCHVYQGKVLIKNVEMFLEPLLHIEPFRLKTIASLATAMDGMNSQATKTAFKILLLLLIAALLLLFCRYSL